MPEEVAIIAVMAILSGTFVSVVRMVLGYRERVRGVESKSPAKTTSGSITTSELERMMRSAVQDATAPLAERIARLEKGGAVPALPAASTHPLESISDDELDALAPEDEAPSRRSKVR